VNERVVLHCRVTSANTAAACSASTVTCLFTRRCTHVLVVLRPARQTADRFLLVDLRTTPRAVWPSGQYAALKIVLIILISFGFYSSSLWQVLRSKNEENLFIWQTNCARKLHIFWLMTQNRKRKKDNRDRNLWISVVNRSCTSGQYGRSSDQVAKMWWKLLR